jgi:alpha-mannosidase
MNGKREAWSLPGATSRREFMKQGAGALLGGSLFAEGNRLYSQSERVRDGRVLHIIGHSHIDAAWLWPWRDASDLVLTTFRSALDRMIETPGFCYSHSSSQHYRWVQAADPAMFEEIKHYISIGQWEVVGGWPVEPDCNLPSTESFVRHCLYGKRFCSQALGVDVKIGFNPDSFGHARGIPTILNHAGYRYYVFMRPQEREMNLPRLFWWEGPDGSRVLTCHIFRSYDLPPARLRETLDDVFPAGCNHGAFLLGVGDHGGAVTKDYIRQILAMKNDPELPELRWSTLREFFSAVEATLPPTQVPIVRGELQHHSRGCYSACGEIKYLNRRTEHCLGTAEAMATVAADSVEAVYPCAAFADAWWHLLFNQFHDVLAGTALYSDYEDARDGDGLACQVANQSKIANLEKIAKQVDLSNVEEGAIFAFNPLPWPRKALLEFHYEVGPDTLTSSFYLRAEDGNKTVAQLRHSESMTNFFPRLSAWIDLPACGYKVFSLEHGESVPAMTGSPRFSIAPRSFGLNSLLAPDRTELLGASMGLVVIEDKSDTWAHGIDSFDKEIGRPDFLSSEVVESGPVALVTRHSLKWRDSSILADIAQFSALDVVQFHFVIDWHEHEQILKLEIPTRLTSPIVTAKVPGAAIQRATNGNEEPYQDWVALQGLIDGKTYTVALMNNCTYSYDCLNGRLRTILIRSAPYARHNPYTVLDDGVYAWQDQGRQERRFWLLGAQGNALDLHLDRSAMGLEMPAEYVLDSRHHGREPWERSFFEVGPDNVEILALKRAEDNSAVVLRVQERAGLETRAYVRCRALRLEKEISLRPWDLKTFRLMSDREGGGEIKEVALLER